MIVTQTKTALAIGLTASFLGVGGSAPYTYSVRANGAGGSIDSSTGLYTAPLALGTDIIQVVDNVGAVASSPILIGTPLILFCDIIQTQMGLANGRVYLWDQKIMQPTDSGLYVAVSVVSCKPFGSSNESDTNGNSIQSVNMYAILQVDIISRDAEARDRKEEIILALNSTYAEAQQEGNSFYIAKLPPGAQFTNLSSPDGTAIPYRFNISVAIQYFATKTMAIPYFSTFATPQVNTNS